MTKYITIALLPVLLITNSLCSVEASMRERVNQFYSNNPYSQFYKGNLQDDEDSSESESSYKNKVHSQKNEDAWIINLRKPIEWNWKRVKKQKSPKKQINKSVHTKTPKQIVERIEKSLKSPLQPSNLRGYKKYINIRPNDTFVKNQANSDINIFDYEPGKIYKVSTSHGFITDIELAPNEGITNINLGDEQRWEINTYLDIDKNTYHLYVQPIQNGIETNMIILTNAHTYQLTLSSYGLPNYGVQWTYPYEIPLKKNTIKEKPNITIDSVNKLDFEYEFEKGRVWQPQFIFNDGKNTFISFDPDEIDSLTPAVFAVNTYNNMVTLVDYEKVGNNIVLNNVYSTFILQIRNKKILVKHK